LICRRRRLTVAPLVAALSVIAAATAIWWGRPQPVGASNRVKKFSQNHLQSAAPDTSGLPAALTRSGLGARPLAGLPDDLVMPTTAKKRSLISRTVLGQVEIKAEYEDTGTVADLRAWMADRLGRLGWRGATAGGPVASAHERVFYKSADTLYLCLKPAPQRVNILVVIQRGAL